MPMSGVRSQELPLHGELSTRLLAPAASTAGWLASMASAGSLTPLSKVSVGSPPTLYLLNGVNEPALAMDANHSAVLAAGANDLVDNSQSIVDSMVEFR